MNDECICKECRISFSNKSNLNKHMAKKVCKNNINKIKYKCVCKKSYTTIGSLNRHQLICQKDKIEYNTLNINDYTKSDLKMIDDLKYEFESFKKNKDHEIDLLKKEIDILKQKDTNVNINSGNTNTNTINNNIVVVTHGTEDMSKIDRNKILACINKGPYRSALHLTDVIHFDADHPENHNIYISNMKNKYAMEYKNNQWNIVLKSELIDKIYRHKKEYIDENINKFYDSLTKRQKETLDEWLQIDDDRNDNEKTKKIKEEICMLLYNKKDIVIVHSKDNIEKLSRQK